MEITYRCFNCSKTFKASEMKKAEVPNNFAAMFTRSEQMSEVDQCPHCDAVAFLGFNTEQGEPLNKEDISRCTNLDEYKERLSEVCSMLRNKDHLLEFETSRHNESIHFRISFHI